MANKDINTAPTIAASALDKNDQFFVSDGGAALKKVSLDNVASVMKGVMNGMPRCKDITSYFTDGSLWNRINGTGYDHPYYDLQPGDYFDMGRTVTAPNIDSGSSGATGSRYVTIADLGGMSGNGDNATPPAYHLVMVPGQGLGGAYHFGQHRMNASNTTVGGYAGSVMNTAVIGDVVSTGSIATDATINQQLYYIFGAHLKTIRELTSNAVDTAKTHGVMTGVASGWAWASYQAILMSEHEVYGASVWGDGNNNVGTACRQLSLFQKCKAAINNRSSWYWLRDVASSSYFALVGDIGYALYSGASYTGRYVRPRFILGA